MVSLIDRIDIMTSQSRKAVQAQKNYADLSLWGMGRSVQSRDLQADEYGAAQAVAIVTEVQRAVKFWGNELGGLVHCLYDGNTDKILWKSTERNPPVGRGAMWAKALKRFARETKHGFFESIAFSDWVYGETFIWKRRNQIQAADFMWLNPLATEPYIMMGEIAYYRYQSDDPDRPYQLNTNEVAFHIAQRNPFDDLRGQSPVLTAINDINIVENVKRSLNAYYRNGMSIGGIVSGKPASEGAWTVDGKTLAEIKADMARSHKGVRNFYEWFFSNAPIDVHPFEQIDIRKNFEIVAPIRKQIAMAMGVPPVLSGDPTEVNYDNADKVMDNWWQTDGIPYASQVAEFVNDDILPSVEPDSDVYFGFDYSKFEIEDPETVSADFTAGYGEITESQKKRGLKVDAALEGIYIINGKPMHRDIIALIAKQVPPEYAQPAAPVAPPTGAPDAPVAPSQPSSTPLLDTLDSDPVAVPPEPKKHSHSHDEIENETWDYTPSLARKELAAWQRHIKAKNARPFEPRYTRGDIADMVLMGLPDDTTSALFRTDEHIASVFDKAFALLPQSLDSLKAAFIAVFDALQADDDITATKSLQSIRLDFEGRFADVLSDIRSGNVDNRRRAGDILRQLIRTFGYRAYVQGLQDGGVMDNPSEEDEAEIARIRSEQSGYVSSITRVLINEDGVSDAQAAGKPEMWFNKTLVPFYQAGLASANSNGLYEWRYGDTEHCSDCKRLHGQRHRLRHWKAKGWLPQAKKLECGGFRCQCQLIPASGKAQGKF